MGLVHVKILKNELFVTVHGWLKLVPVRGVLLNHRTKTSHFWFFKVLAGRLIWMLCHWRYYVGLDGMLYCPCYSYCRFYICCDRCQDWFHGRCVGILQSEADNIDEYICPNCQRNSNINFANMKNLNSKDFEGLRKLIKQLQVSYDCHYTLCWLMWLYFSFSYMLSMPIICFRLIKVRGHSWNL
jgi:hypothetical protein